MIEYAVEPLSLKLIGEMLPLQDQYWKEVAGPFHNFPPDVDWKTYQLAQDSGRLRIVVGRFAGVLKAGAFVITMPHPHYACVASSLPLLFLDPEYRHGREGLRMVRLAEEEAVAAGSQMMMSHGGVHNNVYKLFEHMGYSDFGRYFVKPIGPNTDPVFKER